MGPLETLPGVCRVFLGGFLLQKCLLVLFVSVPKPGAWAPPTETHTPPLDSIALCVLEPPRLHVIARTASEQGHTPGLP